MTRLAWTVLVIVFVIGWALATWCIRHQQQAHKLGERHTRNPSMFHAPKGGCPEGTQAVPDMFELDGKPVPGCFNPNGDGTIDVLYPGESTNITVRPSGR